MNIKAIELYNILNQYNEEELKELDVVIEPKRIFNNCLSDSEYATSIEEYPSHIRIIHKG
jgi:hypothetical protein